MRMLQLTTLMALIVPALCFAQQTTPFTPDSLTRGLWHFDETAGDILFDASGLGNNGFATGTAIVPGRFGNARSYNGFSDYVAVPSSSAFDFDTSSFQIDLWFKAPLQQTMQGQLIRRGLAPDPGYMIVMDHGQIVGQIGNRADSHWPDTLITVRSDSTYGDNKWHLVTMVRDRSVRKLFLYIDGNLATQPSDDPFTIPLNDLRPLTIGRWESDVYPYFFNGVIDEVRLSSPKVIPSRVVIQVQPSLLDFGNVKIGSTDSLLLNISNSGFRDTLRIYSLVSGNPRFTSPSGPLLIPAGKSINIPVSYTPLSNMKDTSRVTITSNDPIVPLLTIPVLGKGIRLAAEPIIDDVVLVPYTYYQLRVRWFRSVYDSAATDPVTEYSVWRSVPGAVSSTLQSHPQPYSLPASALSGPSWEFITTVPALRFDEYSCIVPALVDYTQTYTSNVLMVAARTKDLQIFLSLPDTVQVDPGYVTGIQGAGTKQAVSQFMLSQNYPNPFNPSTTIKFELPRSSHVSLTVYDVLGREISVLVNGNREAGDHEVKFDGSTLASGVYFYRLQAGSFIQTKKLLLLK